MSVKKSSPGEIVATSANQIVPPKFPAVHKCCTTCIFTRPPFPRRGGLGSRLGRFTITTIGQFI